MWQFVCVRCLIRSFCLSAARSLQKCTSYKLVQHDYLQRQNIKIIDFFFYFARCNSESRPRPLFCNSRATVTLHAHRWHVTCSFLCVIKWKVVFTVTPECKTSSRESSFRFLHRSLCWTKSRSSQNKRDSAH